MEAERDCRTYCLAFWSRAWSSRDDCDLAMDDCTVCCESLYLPNATLQSKVRIFEIPLVITLQGPLFTAPKPSYSVRFSNIAIC